MKIDRIMRILVCAAAACAAGCASYYRVMDTSTGQVYYTDDLDRKGSATTFHDARTSAEVTLPATEVTEISSQEFRRNVPR